jgi:hypothetical protein
MAQGITGETRPRPGKFRVTEREALKLSEGREKLKEEKKTEKFMRQDAYVKALKTFIDTFDSYLIKLDTDDRKKNYTIIDDIKKFLNVYKGDYLDFHKKEKKKSSLYNAIYTSSCKMTGILFNIMNSKGPVLVYSNYVLMEGIQIFRIYLKFLGFYNFMDTKKIIKNKVGYVEFHGGIKDRKERDRGMNVFNQATNKYGELIKIMLVSPAGTEGLSLMNVRQVHILEPHWNEVRITQMIGRAVRLCSHKDLPMNERMVDVFRYKAIRPSGKWTADQDIEDRARSKDALIQSFLNAIKEVAIDCVLNKNHNMLRQQYKCFKFDETSLFNKYIGACYKHDIYDDMLIDNGLNSDKSISIKIKVRKIKAVKLLSKPDEEPRYSKVKNYWYYDKSGVVYDYDLHYAIGKVGIDVAGVPMKLDKDTYIITQIIPIPTLED